MKLEQLATWGFVATLAAVIPLARAATPDLVFERASVSVVVVEQFDERGRRAGLASGVVVAPEEVVTSCHALDGAAAIQVRAGDHRYGALLRYADHARDLCQLAVQDLRAAPATLAPLRRLKVGQRVYAIGAPRGLELTLSEGLISALRTQGNSQLIQTSAPMSRGSSGGGLFDSEGRLIGIAAFQLARGQNLNFALPAAWIGELRDRARSAPSSAAPRSTQKSPGQRAQTLARSHDWRGLLAHARTWIQREPRNARARHALARAYAALQQPDSAVDAYLSALKLDSSPVAWWLELGDAQSTVGNAGAALSAYRESVARDPTFALAWMALSRSYLALDRKHEAIDALSRATRAQPQLVSAWQQLASAYADAGRPDLAVAVSREGLRTNAKAPELWFQLAMGYEEMEQSAQALSAYQEVLRLRPDHVDAFYNLGALYAAFGDDERALAIYQRLRRVDSARAVDFHQRYIE